MLSIVLLDSDNATAAAAWEDMAGRTIAWLGDVSVALQDAIVLVPFVQLLPHARRAFAARGGLLPRIETSRTLAASLGPPALCEPRAPTLDAAFDAMAARQMLASHDGGSWRNKDRRGFDRAAVRLVAAAHEIIRAARDVAPAARDDWWVGVRASLGMAIGPGGRERALAAVAVEWAALAAAPDTDRLFSARPAAWIAVQAGGADPILRALLAAARVPCLVLDTDIPLDDPAANAAVASLAPPAFALCDGFEQEAEAAAAQVVEHLRLEQRPVALVAADRVLIRRIRALLERAGTVLVDETGWRLSTTRAAAQVMSLLAASERQASTDQLFEWLKSGDVPIVHRGLAALESACRKQAIWRIAALAQVSLSPDEAEAARRFALDVLAPLQKTGRQTICEWLVDLGQALGATGALDAMQRDVAGRQVIAALGLRGEEPAASRLALARETVSLADFTQWVDEVLEHATFIPPADARAADSAGIDVVVTPLARAMLRPFAAVVLPGADDRHLGAYVATESLLPTATRKALAGATPADRQRGEWLAFCQLLRVPRVTLLRRRSDGVEPVSTSTFVDRLSLVLAARGQRLRSWQPTGSASTVTPRPLARRGPSAPGRVPERLSATGFEALRACPYRFFATRMLGAAEDAELDGDLEKRDYGSWLHDVLHRFHAERAMSPEDATVDESALRSAGANVLAHSAFDAAEFLPWGAAFEAFVPRYVRWLREREAGGARWVAGEAERRIRPPELEGVELYGIIDRIDAVTIDGTPTIELIDYKTGGAQSLKARVREPFEDTQLAFYAALMAGDASERGAPLKATYLALEARPDLELVEHRGVAASAAALVEGVAVDLRRLWAGAALVPLGEGDACRYCEVRGLCRRDHWTVDAVEPRSASGERSA